MCFFRMIVFFFFFRDSHGEEKGEGEKGRNGSHFALKLVGCRWREKKENWRISCSGEGRKEGRREWISLGLVAGLLSRSKGFFSFFPFFQPRSESAEVANADQQQQQREIPRPLTTDWQDEPLRPQTYTRAGWLGLSYANELSMFIALTSWSRLSLWVCLDKDTVLLPLVTRLPRSPSLIHRKGKKGVWSFSLPFTALIVMIQDGVWFLVFFFFYPPFFSVLPFLFLWVVINKPLPFFLSLSLLLPFHCSLSWLIIEPLSLPSSPSLCLQ